MNIFITGASGFIGERLVENLAEGPHLITCAVRRIPQNRSSKSNIRYVQVDFTKDFNVSDWLPRLINVDVVINAVGILRERGTQTFAALHDKTPRALFAASKQSNVSLVIQISALGADEHATSAYHLSKKKADDFLVSLGVPFVIVQPSLVYGPGGTSAKLFNTLASMPLIPLPGTGMQMVQPIHIDDIVSAIAVLTECDIFRDQKIPLVGPSALSMREFLAALRTALGLGKPRYISIPINMVRLAARLSPLLPNSLLDKETLQMLERGNTAGTSQTCELLDRDPRPVQAFIPSHETALARTQAKLQWLLPLLRFSVALTWIITGIVSFGLYPVQESYVLLNRVGVGREFAPLFLYTAATLDLAIGIAILALSRRRLLWLLQLTVIAAYTIIITWKLPEFWLHPYGPILKNIPLLVAIWLLYEFEER